MSERDAFLRAIADNPADDTVRLAFADWLDEHDEPARAEFIRVQIKLANANPKNPRNKKLESRADALFDAHNAEWLGPLAEYRNYRFKTVFRRGFVEKAEIFGTFLLEHDEAIAAYCPALTELHVIGIRDNGAKLAKAECLNSVRTLRLEDWPYPADAKALAKSPNLTNVETLSVWLGSENDTVVCGTLASSKKMAKLRSVELYELQSPSSKNSRALALAAGVNKALLKHGGIATIICPNESLFTLGPDVGWRFHGGTVPDGRQVLVQGGKRCEVYYFDAQGKLIAGENLNLSRSLKKLGSYYDYDKDDLFAVLKKRIGFAPGTIRVKEFWASSVLPNSHTCVYKFDSGASSVFEAPDLPHERLAWDDWEDIVNTVHHEVQSTDFCIFGGGDVGTADDRGSIHSN